MKNFFDINSPIMIFLGRVMDLMILSLLWIVFSVPIITIGPATTALYYVTLKIVREKESGIVKCFWSAFKENLKQGIILSIILIIGGVVLGFDCWFFAGLNESIGIIPKAVFGVLMFLYLGLMCYIYPLLAQFSNTILGTLRNAFLLSTKNIILTVLVILLNCVPVMVALLSLELYLKLIPIWILVAPAGIAYLCSIRFVKVFDPLIERAKSAGKEDVQSQTQLTS